jgi:D-alanyl-D-alanine carboxypeptidase/D-alanyl-D-alanine-endopeptidase (penicillin-binding protein 4)
VNIFKSLLLAGASTLALSAQLPEDIINFIQKDKIDVNNLSILVTNRANGQAVASLNANTPRVPASVAKIATCYAALLEFGKDFKWPTQIYYTGSLKAGVLNGDLVVKAYGDPTLRAINVKNFAKKIRGYGIKEIKGNLVVDRTFFKNSPTITSGFDKNYVSEYNAMPDALMYNDHLNRFEIVPSKSGVNIRRSYGDRSYKIVNKLKAVNTSCRGANSWPKVQFIRHKDSVDVVLAGKLSSKCRPIVINRVLSMPYKSFYFSFADYLHKAGVKFRGNLILATKPKSAKLLFTNYSKSLIKIVAKTLKKSNNLYARQLFLILGAKRYGYPATLQKSQRAIRDILVQKGVMDSGDFIVNGSGLSTESRLKATTAKRIHDSAYRDFGQDWLNALSIAGVDGTIKKRFKHSPVKRHAFMKTGTLKRAKNIAGFVKSIKGNFYDVAIFYNGAKIWLGKDIQDKIIHWLVTKK